jgi:hypothetical protein
MLGIRGSGGWATVGAPDDSKRQLSNACRKQDNEEIGKRDLSWSTLQQRKMSCPSNGGVSDDIAKRGVMTGLSSQMRVES